MIDSLIPYILLAMGLCGTLALFLSVKREIHGHASKNRKRLDDIATRLKEAESSPEPVYTPPPVRSALNTNKRIQAVRMLRRNEDVSHVAAVLGMTRSEVELLVRIH